MKKKTTEKVLFNVPVREIYIHKYVGKIQAVDITVFIDYALGTISLIEKTGQGYDISKPKQWIFTGRTISYMEGWLDILDAMKDAVKTAKDRLDVYQKERALEQAMMQEQLNKALKD